jgi:hypothetical protein
MTDSDASTGDPVSAQLPYELAAMILAMESAADAPFMRIGTLVEGPDAVTSYDAYVRAAVLGVTESQDMQSYAVAAAMRDTLVPAYVRDPAWTMPALPTNEACLKTRVARLFLPWPTVAPAVIAGLYPPTDSHDGVAAVAPTSYYAAVMARMLGVTVAHYLEYLGSAETLRLRGFSGAKIPASSFDVWRPSASAYPTFHAVIPIVLGVIATYRGEDGAYDRERVVRESSCFVELSNLLFVAYVSDTTALLYAMADKCEAMANPYQGIAPPDSLDAFMDAADHTVHTWETTRLDAFQLQLAYIQTELCGVWLEAAGRGVATDSPTASIPEDTPGHCPFMEETALCAWMDYMVSVYQPQYPIE